MINAERGTIKVEGAIDEVLADLGCTAHVAKSYIQAFEFSEEEAKALIVTAVERGLNVKKGDNENE